MDTMNSAFVLWLGLMSLVPPAPTYEIEHFYTYNREHKQQALLLQKQVFVPENKDAQAALVKLKLNTKLITRFDKMKAPHTPGWVVVVENNRLAIELMAELSKSNTPYSPVVKWEGMDCIPTNRIILQTKPFVTEKLLQKRLTETAKVKVVSLERLEGNQWVVDAGESVVPNMLVLANLISEDTAWVEWARVVFVPLRTPMSGSMSVTTPAVLNLGYNKQLEVVITVYKPSVKIRKDLLPKLGGNFFVPQPAKDDVWYDVGPTKITEESSLEKTVIRMTTPFRYLNFGKISIPNIQVAYDDNKVQGTFLVPGVTYDVQSVIADTDIDDIQAMPVIPPLSSPTAADKFARVILPWRMVGVVGAGVGLGLILLVCFVMGVKSANKFSLGRATKAANAKLWQDLLEAPQAEGDWRKVYTDVSKKLSKVLAVFYNINAPIGADSTENPTLANVLRELEKLYKQDAKPDPKRLAHDVSHFVNQSKANV